MSPSGDAYFPAHDGNGNVMALYDSSTGSAVATYEYSPFGELLRADGAYAKENPFRFSSKFTDDDTGLVYYGYRYYSPSLGRFINRDPIGESGGNNLYGFAGNDPVNGVDVLGLTEADDFGRGGGGSSGWSPFLGHLTGVYTGESNWSNSWQDIFYRTMDGMYRDAMIRDGQAASRRQWDEQAGIGRKIDQFLVYRCSEVERSAARVAGSPSGSVPDSPFMRWIGRHLPGLDIRKGSPPSRGTAAIDVLLRELIALGYPPELARKIIYHYMDGSGTPLNLSAAEMGELGATINLMDSPDFRLQVELAKLNRVGPAGTNIRIGYTTARGEGHGAVLNGTLGNFGVIVEGTLWIDDSGQWHFSGTMSFSDTIDFDAKPPGSRPSAAEARVTVARVVLPGTPYAIISDTVPVMQVEGNAEAIWSGSGNQDAVRRRNSGISQEAPGG